MSVQAGIWNFDGRPVNHDILDRLSHTAAEYGPDGETRYVNGAIGMLYRPFQTTRESRLEQQPYFSANGVLLTWDGRLDNRDDLVTQFHSELGADRTDAAIVAAGFQRWGTNCFEKFVGEWAVTVWDSRNRELLLARDYIGVRHLFYYQKGTRFVWSNHLASLALIGDTFTICDEYVAGYFGYYPDAHLTPYCEVHSVLPGAFVRVREGGATVRRYWTFNPQPKLRFKSDGEYEEQYRFLFRQAVRRRLRTDSPVLAELSGGLDSSSIVCMADDVLSKREAEAPRLDTISYYDSNEPREDDFFHLSKVEERRGRVGIHADLAGCGNSLSFEYTSFAPTPGFNLRAEITAAFSEMMKQRAHRVTLSGTGGDEFNGQPLNIRIIMAELLIDLRLVELSGQLTTWSLLSGRPWMQLLIGSLIQLLPDSLRARLTEQGRIDHWVERQFARKHRLAARQVEAVKGLWPCRPSVRDSVQTILTLGRELTYETPSLMERRFPFLDQTLVKFMTTIPLDQLVRPGQRRSLMRRALSEFIPPEILVRKTKAAARRCYPLTLERHWSVVEELFSAPLTSRLGYVHADRVLHALRHLRDGHVTFYFGRLLSALSLELWLRDAHARGIISISPSVFPRVRREMVESGA